MFDILCLKPHYSIASTKHFIRNSIDETESQISGAIREN